MVDEGEALVRGGKVHSYVHRHTQVCTGHLQGT